VTESMYGRIYRIVRLVPRGRVASYGQIARIAGRCSPRNVGYAMAAVPADSGVPWHRIVNSRGMISVRSHGGECTAQRQLLEGEGIEFGPSGRIDMRVYGWEGPGA
jgi:methylated-DNA-protein-cysteine methyltransferase-like protein